MSIGNMELNLDNRGLVLIEGKNDSDVTFESNGSGKTSIISAITYAIYGQTTYGIKADDVINRHFGKNMSVKLDFDVDGVPYTIERYRKDKKHKNKVILFKEGKDISGKSAKETEDVVLGLFGVDYQTYMNSIVQGQGNSEVFTKATDKGKKDILENITNIAVYKKAQDVAKGKVNEQELNYKEVVAKIEKLNTELEYLVKQEENELATYSYTQNMITEAEEEMGVKLNKLQQEQRNRNIDQLLERKSMLEAVEQPTVKFEPTQEELDLDKKIKEVQQGGQDILTNVRIMQSEMETKRKEQQSLDTRTDCAYCGAPLDATHAEKEFNRLEAEIQRTQDICNQINTTYRDQFTPMLQAMITNLTGLERARISKYEASQKEYHNTQEHLKKVVQELNHSQNVLGSLDVDIRSLQSNLDNLNSIPKPVKKDQEKRAIQDQLTQANVELLAISGKKSKYEDTVKLFSNAGIRSVVLDLVTPYLNERANKYLATLTGSEIEIVFTTQVKNKDDSLADRFDVQILNASGGDTYKSNSEGEKKRIDLAISFAIQDLVLSKTNLKTNIALYDECFESLDEVGCENVITILKERQEQIGTLFVITHNVQLKALFENVITVHKVDGISTIEK